MSNYRGTWRGWAAAACCASLAGCAVFAPAPTPMRFIDYPAAARPAQCLFVLLPGFGDHARTFEERGFVESLRSRRLSIDVRAVEAVYRYYLHGTVLDRLRADVIAPAKARGYREIWIAGPSMGGFGSLFYTRKYTADISGVLAIAPYLGDDSLIREIIDAGGLEHWRAPPRVERPAPGNYQREMWRWFQAVTRGEETAPPIFIGFGSNDKMRVFDAILAAALPPARVFRTEGGHEWPVWRVVLEKFLDSPGFSGHCRRENP